MVTTGLAILEYEGGLEIRILTDLTILNASAVRAAVLSLWEDRGKPQLLVLDLAGARHIDSSGVGTLLEIGHRIESSGVRLVLAGLNPHSRRMLDRTGLDILFQIHEAGQPGVRDLAHC